MSLALLMKVQYCTVQKVQNLESEHSQKNNKFSCIPFVEQTVSPEGSSATEGKKNMHADYYIWGDFAELRRLCKNIEPYTWPTHNYSYWPLLVSGAPLGLPGADQVSTWIYDVWSDAVCRCVATRAELSWCSENAQTSWKLRLTSSINLQSIIYTSHCPVWHFLPSLVSMSAAYLPCTTSLDKNVATIIKVVRPSSIWIK